MVFIPNVVKALSNIIMHSIKYFFILNLSFILNKNYSWGNLESDRIASKSLRERDWLIHKASHMKNASKQKIKKAK